jgi:hypothetical protein
MTDTARRLDRKKAAVLVGGSALIARGVIGAHPIRGSLRFLPTAT